jgi:hypothetical protein
MVSRTAADISLYIPRTDVTAAHADRLAGLDPGKGNSAAARAGSIRLRDGAVSER